MGDGRWEIGDGRPEKGLGTKDDGFYGDQFGTK